MSNSDSNAAPCSALFTRLAPSAALSSDLLVKSMWATHSAASSASTIDTGIPASRSLWMNRSSARVNEAFEEPSPGGALVWIIPSPVCSRRLPYRRPRCEQANAMTDFRPVRAPRGRLVRLGVVLDTRNAPNRLREVARMCDGAGIEALWVRDHLAAPDGEPRLEAWTALTLVGVAAPRPRVGALLNVAFRPPGMLAAMAGTLDAVVGGRLEVGLSAGWLERENLAFGFDFPAPDVR